MLVLNVFLSSLNACSGIVGCGDSFGSNSLLLGLLWYSNYLISLFYPIVLVAFVFISAHILLDDIGTNLRNRLMCYVPTPHEQCVIGRWSQEPEVQVAH